MQFRYAADTADKRQYEVSMYDEGKKAVKERVMSDISEQDNA